MACVSNKFAVLWLSQELFHAIDHRFTTIAVRQKVQLLGARWREKIAPANTELAEEMVKAPPESTVAERDTPKLEFCIFDFRLSKM